MASNKGKKKVKYDPMESIRQEKQNRKVRDQEMAKKHQEQEAIVAKRAKERLQKEQER